MIADRFRGRVIFPVYSLAGKVIAFGGRTLEANPNFAKYLNTAETELFNKRNTLYAVNYLKKQKNKYFNIGELYMDEKGNYWSSKEAYQMYRKFLDI